MSPQHPIYVLDTNVLSALAHQRPIQSVADWIRHVDGQLVMPMAAVIEIQRGISYLRARKPQRAADLDAWLESLLASDIAVVPMDVTIARLYADLTTVPALKNLWMPCTGAMNPKLGQDLSVAATAIGLRAAVATANVRDFLAIHRHQPLEGIFDPVQGAWHIPLPTKKAINTKPPGAM